MTRREWLHWRIKDLRPHSWTVCRGDYPTSNLGPHAEWVRVREVLQGDVTITYKQMVELFADMDCSLESSLKALSKLFGPLPEGTNAE